MKNIILIAPPGAGKGTQASMLVEKLNMLHISIGDLLRNEVNKQTELGKSLEVRMQTGKLVDDEIIFEVLKSYLKDADLSKGIIFDGFPRNISQAQMLDSLDIKIDSAIYLDVPKSVLESRILGRKTCPNCKTGYNSNFENMKPKVEDICDKCGSKLITRQDDTKDVFENRYETYINETQPVLEFYKNKQILFNIKSLDKDEIFNNIIKIIDNTLPLEGI